MSPWPVGVIVAVVLASSGAAAGQTPPPPTPPPPVVTLSTDVADYLVRESHPFFGPEPRAWMETSVRFGGSARYKALTIDAAGLALKTTGDDKFGSGPDRPVRFGVDRLSAHIAQIGGSSLSLTAGRQSIALGSQFLIGDGVYDGFSTGADQAVYHNPRKGFDAVRVQWAAGAVAVDAFVYRVHPTWDGGAGDDGLVGGVDVSGESTRTKGRYAAGLFHRHSESDLDNDMTLVNVRATQPLAGASGVYAGGELVWEFAGRCRSAPYCTTTGQSMNEQAWHAEVGFAADDRRFQPAGEVGYVRYSDDYTPLATGFSDWGRWYLGNQIDWMLFGTDSSIVRGELGFRPHATVRVRGQFHHTRLVSARPVTPDALSNEASLIIEWFPTATAWVSVLAGSSRPAAGLAASGLGNPFAFLNPGAAPAGTRPSFDVVVAVGYAFRKGW